MKKVCGSKAPIDESWGQWQPWFAWHPVRFWDGDTRYCCWLRSVERRTKNFRGIIWPENIYTTHEYRIPTDSTDEKTP